MKYDINIDSFIGYPISKGYISSLLKNYKNKPVTVRINSYGGDVQHALDIRQQFIDHGDVTVYIYGMTASSATILAMGAKKIVMSKYATMLVHNCMGYVDAWGRMNSQQIEDAIKKLTNVKEQVDKVDEIIANIYADRSGTDIKKLAEVMAKNQWLSAQECKQLGLIDEISEEGEKTKMTDEVKDTLVACGYPVPGITADGKPAVKVQEPSTLETICRSFIDNISRFFGMEQEDKKPQHEAEKPEQEEGEKPKDNASTTDESREKEKEVKPLNTIDMNKYKTLSAIEGFKDIKANEDGTVSLSAEQLEKLEAHINSLNGQISEKDAKINELGKKDGDDTKQVHDEGKKEESFEDIYNSVQKYVH